MKHVTEEDLIAYQMGDAADAKAIRRHLEICGECASHAEAIAETLRVFSAEPTPVRSAAQMEQSWQRLRGNLSVLDAKPKRRFALWLWPSLGLVTAALVLMVAGLVHVRRSGQDGSVAGNDAQAANASIGDTLRSLVRRKQQPRPINGHGPLTDIPADPAIEAHLDSAERLLTEVNHISGPLDEDTREQARTLMLKNAVYSHSARERGDLSEAAVLDNLGRVLVGLEHAPETPRSTWQLRVEMNTDGLLLDLRILRQNDEHERKPL